MMPRGILDEKVPLSGGFGLDVRSESGDMLLLPAGIEKCRMESGR